MTDKRVDRDMTTDAVVSLDRRRRISDDEARDLGAFVSYWKRMRREDGLPRRSDIDPRGIGALISNAFVIERIAPGLARLRIAGTHLSDLLGMDVRGMPLSALFQPDHRDPLADDLVRLFDEPAMVRLRLALHGGDGVMREATMILLPLRSDLGDVSRALGCVVSHDALGRPPHRFEILRRTITPLAMTPETGRVAPSAPAFADQRAPFSPRPARASSERPYLRLVR